MTKDQILTRIDALLEIEGIPGNLDSIAGAVMETYLGTLTLIGILYGMDSPQAETLKGANAATAKYAGHPAFGLAERLLPTVKGALRTMRTEVDVGLVGNVTRRAMGEVMGDFLGLAKEALGDNDPNAKNVAAVLVAASFEDTIRKMGETLVGVEGRPDLADVLSTLKKGKVLLGATYTTAQSYLKFRNDSLHADWTNVTPAVITSCLSFTDQLLMRHFS